MRLPYVLSIALLSLTFLQGCIIEADDDRTEVRSLEVVFSVNDAIINGDVASVQFTVPSITPAVVDYGAVLAYFREQGTWTAMPYTFADESPDLLAVDYTITMGFGYDDGFLEMFYEASTDEAPFEAQPDRIVRIVVIDDLTFSNLANIDVNDYDSVRQALQLED